MKQITFFTIIISIFGFSQEKFTTQDFGLHKNTETVISKQYWEDDQSNVVFTEELKFYNSQIKFDWEAGEFDVMVGTSSAEVKTARINWSK